MIERKWTPLREKHGKEPIEIEKTEDSVVVGYLDKYGADLLRDDVIRLFNTGYYDIDTRCTDQGRALRCVRLVRRNSTLSRRDGRSEAAAVEGLSGPASTFRRFTVLFRAAWLKHFETKSRSRRSCRGAEEAHRNYVQGNVGDGVEEPEVREFEEPRSGWPRIRGMRSSSTTSD